MNRQYQTWKLFEKALYVSRGSENDPLLILNEREYDYYTIEDTLWEMCKEEVDYNTDILFIDDNFKDFCSRHEEDVLEVFASAPSKKWKETAEVKNKIKDLLKDID